MAFISQQLMDSVQGMNETAIRATVIDPILNRLGYGVGLPGVFISYEMHLIYPYYFIGRKTAKKDQPLGYPDYWCGLESGGGSFIVEAKPGHEKINQSQIEQAHSYASHAQVRARFFVICNGFEFRIYETLAGIDHGPIVNLLIRELESRWHEIEAILSPENLKRHCEVKYDIGLPIAPGFGSEIRIIDGIYTLDSWSYDGFVNGIELSNFPELAPIFDVMRPKIDEIVLNHDMIVKSGIVTRDDDGQIFADVYFKGINRINQRGMEVMDLVNFRFYTTSNSISLYEENPTEFRIDKNFSISKGAMIPSIDGKEDISAGFDISCFVSGTLMVHVNKNKIVGSYAASAQYDIDLLLLGKLRLNANFIGKIDIDLLI